ncbi:protein kinase/lanthionine synthetase C family protein [Streptomyces erythrochromogenes]|uniref:Protein kinase/lanthionine synthetase C family protein n=1 Tax=Streptomyces erythrochromogenes TaxID=285574 RepID=A0ABZ1QK13_9ACTN|nr:protein kinase/lanthionine synthetase C family protein [Streptomyces erythrochromogenes]
MRNGRWVHRSLFTWNDTLFFDPLDAFHEPDADHFLAGLDAVTRARFVRRGLRWSHRHDPAPPEQGWKIHISAGHRQVREIAASVVGHLTARGTDFEIALDPTVFAMRGGGRLATVYPHDVEEFRSCLAGLARLLDGVEGPYVPSDVRYRDSKALYLRYGPFRDARTVDVLGRRLPPAPDWAPWPFDDWKPADEDAGDGLLGGRFRVTDTIRSSHDGGVHTAEDTAHDDRKVLLKEARHDAVDRLGREWMFLNLLAAAGSYPAPVARFQHGEHHYIAMEFVEGTGLGPLLLAGSPLARPGFDAARSREYLRTFLSVFRGLARAVRAAHDRGVVLGGFTASDVLVDPDTHEVTIVGLESCRLTGAGAENASGSGSAGGGATEAGDRYALACVMADLVLPVTAMAYLREDFLDLYRIFVVEGLGWPERVHRLLVDLARGRIGLVGLLDVLEDGAEPLGPVGTTTPRPSPAVEERPGTGGAEAAASAVAAFIDAAADTGRDTLFPVDPFAHVTNPLGLGSGASGVLWALHSSGAPVRPAWREWLRAELAGIDPARYPDGLMNGLAGIAWAADSLGLGTAAGELLDRANRHVVERGDHTFHHGLAGVGMTNLHFFLRSRDPRDLAAAQHCARALHDTAQRDGGQAYWLTGSGARGPLTGLGSGQAGVAMFLLRMHQISGEEHHLALGREALAWETARAAASGEEGITGPSVESGSAGVAKVLLRYGDLAAARGVLRGLDLRYSAGPGYATGMCGIADALLDAAQFTGDPAYRDTALRQLDFVRRVFLFEPAERFGLRDTDGRPLLGVPGEGLLRCSTDYLTGSAGVLRVLHRAGSGGTADFLLDEVGPP